LEVTQLFLDPVEVPDLTQGAPLMVSCGGKTQQKVQQDDLYAIMKKPPC
jgi:hypothetical protein